MQTALTIMFQAGGVEETINKDFDLDKALNREYARACMRMCEDLRAAGFLKVSEKEISGNYTRQYLILLLPK